jgi:DNA topoisomerase-1
MNLETAKMVLSLPRDLGLHPVTNKKIVANIGRFGPYVNHDAKFKSIPKTESVFTIDLDGAVALLAAAHTGPAPLCSLGSHPTEDGQIEVFAGRYGPYVQHGKIRATLPKSIEPESLTLDEALELLTAKVAKGEPTKKTTSKKSSAKKSAASKEVTKKPTATKTIAKKTVAKKPTDKKPVAKKQTTKKADS